MGSLLPRMGNTPTSGKNVSVIETASNMVTTVVVGTDVTGVAVTPDGKHAARPINHIDWRIT
jgi:DNA-binding beta-propeller fold protein YncE